MTAIKAVRRLIPVLLLLLTSCVTQTAKDYTKFYSESPRSILIVPVVNNTVDVDAPRYFLATVTVPLAERGYYTFPINLVRGVMDEEGLSDANLVHQADPTVLGAMFGADAILYITIEHWETVYIILSATTTVSFKYSLKSGRTGETLWEDASTVQYTPQSNSGGGVGGLIAMAVAAAIQKAAPNYMPLARQANQMALWTPGKGLPAGPYHGEHGADLATFPGTNTNTAAASAPTKEQAPGTTKPAAEQPNPPPKAATVSSSSACSAEIRINLAHDRGRIARGIQDYAELNGIGSPNPSHNVKTVGSISIEQDDCGTGIVRADITTSESRYSRRDPAQTHQFFIKKDAADLKVTGCKDC